MTYRIVLLLLAASALVAALCALDAVLALWWDEGMRRKQRRHEPWGKP